MFSLAYLYAYAYVLVKTSLKDVKRQWEREWGGRILFSFGVSNARGVAIFFKNGFDTTVDSVKAHTQGRCLVLKGKIHDEKYFIVNVYGPNRNT